MTIDERLSVLRTEMSKHNIDAYIIPTSDPHQSEYVAEHWTGRTWISGFTGSAGTVVITHDHAGLWTDSRYFLQATEQLSSSSFELHKVSSPTDPNFADWLEENMTKGQKVGFDGYLISSNEAKSIKKRMEKKGASTIDNIDLIDIIWSDRPSLPKNKIFIHELKYTGLSRIEKIDQVREKMVEMQASSHFVSTLDDIAWILNIRSNDVECNPVTIAYLVINEEDVLLFIDSDKVSDSIQMSLKEDNILLKPYSDINNYLSTSKKILIDPSICSNTLYNAIDKDEIICGDLPARMLKAIKNDVEVAHIRRAMVKDGVALTKFFMWLENEVDNNPTEFEIGEKLAFYRKQQDYYFGESFNPIVGFKGNGAIVHYRAPEVGSAKISREGMLLIDSGGQYHDGTTDITRTVHLGDPTKEEKRNFTLVLKGHIALAEIVYPEGTYGANLDTLARQYLWKDRLNYLHGTGHGVGFFMNVHEPPQGFTAGLTARSKTMLKHGMFTSNEPGYYKSGAYGIRIENLILTIKDEVEGFLKHETLTLFPIEKNLIEETILDNRELSWINRYHAKVYDELSPFLSEKEAAWLKHKCRV